MLIVSLSRLNGAVLLQMQLLLFLTKIWNLLLYY